MHADMAPWWPIAPDNRLLGIISVDQLHLACLAAGIAGALWALAVAIRAKRKRIRHHTTM